MLPFLTRNQHREKTLQLRQRITELERELRNKEFIIGEKQMRLDLAESEIERLQKAVDYLKLEREFYDESDEFDHLKEIRGIESYTEVE